MREMIYKAVNLAHVRLFFIARKLLSQRRRTRIKESLATFRKRMSSLYLLLHGSYSARDLVNEVSRRIPADFEILMVHSSFDRLVPMLSESPQSLIDELVRFCGPKRTLVMPTFFLGGKSYDSKEYYRSHVFDVKKTISQMGLLTEVFRRIPGVKRSLHPTHSICALGPLADELTATHHLACTRTGKGTPFELMAGRKTVVVGLGLEYFRGLVQTHTAEDLLCDDFPVRFDKESIPVTLIDWSGKPLSYNLTILKTEKILDNSLVRSLLSDDELTQWRFKGTPLYVTFADKVTERLIAAARKGITVYRS